MECLALYSSDIKAETFGVGGAELNWIKVYGLEKPNLLIGGHQLKVCCRFSWQIDFVQSLITNDGYKKDITLGVALVDHKGTPLFGCNGFDYGVPIDCLQNGFASVEFNLKLPYLNEGDYFLTTAIALGNLKHHVQLKWYDSLIQLKCMKEERNVFGVFAIDYEMKKISTDELVYE